MKLKWNMSMAWLVLAFGIGSGTDICGSDLRRVADEFRRRHSLELTKRLKGSKNWVE